MAARVRALDWAATPLGAAAEWSEALSTLVSQVLASPMPAKLVWGADLIQIYNDAFIPVLGHKHPAALGVPMRVSSPEVWAASKPVYDQARRDGRGVFETDRVVPVARADGTIDRRLFTVGYAPVRGRAGSIAGFVVTLIETTARARAEGLLQESRERLNLLVEHAGVGIVQTDMNNRITYVNPAFCALLGRDAAELTTLRIPDLTHPDDVSSNMAAFDDMVRFSRPFAVEKRYLRADGSAVWVHNNVSFTLAPDGAKQSATAIVQDITHRKAAEEELELRVRERTRQLSASESRARALFDNSPDLQAIISRSESGAFVFEDVNSGVMKALGRPREQLIGAGMREIYPADAADEAEREFRRCIEGDLPITYVAKRSMGGQVRWFEVTLSPLPDPATGLGGRLIVSSARDITERRAMEEQLLQAQKMEAVGQLTGGIAHDFNNLLTVITGNLELIERKSADEAARRRAHNAMRAASRGAELTAQLLAFSRRQFLTLAPLSLNDVVRGMSDMLARTMGGRVAIRTALAPGLRLALGDPTQIETALLNLAINARDAMPQGGGVTFRTENVPAGSGVTSIGPVPEELAGTDTVLVVVSDTGTGMSDEVRARVFEPFFTTKAVGKGSGLGLSMVYGVAKQLGGAVSIASVVGAGTDIGIYLPVAPTEAIAAPPEPGAPEPGAPEPGAGAGADIMVVDDDHDVRELTASFLREIGHRTIEAATGRDVIALLESGAPCDLLLLDLAMPGLSGTETARLARAARPGIAVLYASGYPDVAPFTPDEDSRLLHKPFNFDDLARTVREVLAR